MKNFLTFSKYFNIDKSQYELDFVDIPIDNGDIPLFIDPYAISKRDDAWSIDCHNAIVDFFQGIINKIKKGEAAKAKYILSGLREPNQTRFGLSVGKKPRGRGIGGDQAGDLYHALSESTAIKTGFIKDLEECELLIEGISRDKISDIATNIIRDKLIEYTQGQCELWNIQVKPIPSGIVWHQKQERWINYYVNLPVCNNSSIILVPKAIARFNMEFNHQEYYQHFVLNFLQEEHMSANSSLVRTLKDGTKKPPYKNVLQKLNPLSKQYLYEFSKQHPDVLVRYKNSKQHRIKDISVEDLLSFVFEEGKDEIEADFKKLDQKLNEIPTGDSSAADFHNHIIGVLTAIFYPSLINPRKEREIHDGRKRIDIVFQNAAREGFFLDLPNIKSVPSAYIPVECKNYSSDPANPELDQLAGRFSTNRGKFGLLVCRNFNNKELFIKRCKDTAQDGRGFIIPLDDTDLRTLLKYRKKNDFQSINSFFEGRYQKLVM